MILLLFAAPWSPSSAAGSPGPSLGESSGSKVSLTWVGWGMVP